MKLFDLKAAIKDVYGKTHWRTIGTVFAADDGSLVKRETVITNGEEKLVDKPTGFVIDYPTCQGIIVPRPKKTREPGDDDNRSPTDDQAKP